MLQLSSSTYDIIFLVIISASAILALVRGGVNEILSLSVWILAFLSMKHGGKYIDHYLPASITNNIVRDCLIFIILFVGIAIIITLIKKICASIINAIGLGGLNRLLGIIFGIMRGILFAALLIVIIEMFNIDHGYAWKKAKLYPVIKPVIIWVNNGLPNQMKDLPSPGQLIERIESK